MRFPFAFSAFVAAVLLVSCATGPTRHSRYGEQETIDISAIPGDTAFDRSAFGTAPLPFWSQLTPPEVRALQGRDRAAAEENHALLQLAIFASGDRRSDSDYASITARFDAFVARERPALDAIADPDRKADKLLHDMHAGFFKRGKVVRGHQPGYDYDQSAFTGIFTEGKYNCVSSAILYVLLAREFGFTAQGAVMPRHAYAHLVYRDGRSAEVETTTPDGCEKAHAGSEAPARPASWYSARGLDPRVALDYSQRRLVSPFELISFNMRNQHLVPLSLRDRYRVLEAGAWVSPGSRQAQLDRIAIWELEYRYLASRSEWDVAHRMFGVIFPLLPGVRDRLGPDSAGTEHPAWLAFSLAHTDLELGKLDQAIAYADTTLAWIPAGGDPNGGLRGNVMGLVMRVSQKLVEADRFPQAEKLLVRFPGYLKDSSEYRANLSWVYSNESHAAWKRSDWAGAIDCLEKALKYARPKDAPPLEQDLGGAYFNRALAYRERGESQKAQETLRHCRDRVPKAKECRTDL
jgi:tetratricopeptide (TPR) repeat protein